MFQKGAARLVEKPIERWKWVYVDTIVMIYRVNHEYTGRVDDISIAILDL